MLSKRSLSIRDGLETCDKQFATIKSRDELEPELRVDLDRLNALRVDANRRFQELEAEHSLPAYENDPNLSWVGKREKGLGSYVLTILLWWIILLFLVQSVAIILLPHVEYFARMVGAVSATDLDTFNKNFPFNKISVGPDWETNFTFPHGMWTAVGTYNEEKGDFSYAFVGVVQKLTLLAFVIGSVELWNIADERKRAQTVLDSPSAPNPLLAHFGRDKVALFPRRMLTMTPVANGLGDAYQHPDPFIAYCDTVSATIEGVAKSAPQSILATFLGYVSDVLVAGTQNSQLSGVARFADSREPAVRATMEERFWLMDYLIWLLPTIGFLGTIYGIGEGLVTVRTAFIGNGALSIDAEKMKAAISTLGIAFDTTAFALALVAVLLWMQKRSEKSLSQFVDATLRAVRKRLISNLRGTDAVSDFELLREVEELTRRLTPKSPTTDSAGQSSAREG